MKYSQYPAALALACALASPAQGAPLPHKPNLNTAGFPFSACYFSGRWVGNESSYAVFDVDQGVLTGELHWIDDGFGASAMQTFIEATYDPSSYTMIGGHRASAGLLNSSGDITMALTDDGQRMVISIDNMAHSWEAFMWKVSPATCHD